MFDIYKFISTGLYIGYSKIAPGTLGSITVIILLHIISSIFHFNIDILKYIFFVTVLLIGSYSVKKIIGDTISDPSYIVIDEWAGQLFTLLFVPVTLSASIGGFFLFRLFDITKLWPINKAEKLHGYKGVMADDLVAGLIAGIILAGITAFFS